MERKALTVEAANKRLEAAQMGPKPVSGKRFPYPLSGLTGGNCGKFVGIHCLPLSGDQAAKSMVSCAKLN
jgi:hypothetical protein